jgi:hypothetical protein
MCAAVKLSGRELIVGGCGGWELFVDLLIDEEPLGPECIPRTRTGNDEGK